MKKNTKEILAELFNGTSISEEDSQFLFSEIFSGRVSEVELSAMIMALKLKGETSDEISGAAKSMREFCAPLNAGEKTFFDSCGTGGDSSGSINISSPVSIILSSMGVPIAKHGNRSVSGKSGSTDFMESLGIPADLKGTEAEDYLNKHDYIYMAAPNYHPAMKYAAPIRKALATRTIFNYLGPLTNPAATGRQAIGFFSPDLLEKYAETASKLNFDRVIVYSGMDGMDEVSPFAKTVAYEIQNNKITKFTIDPEEFISKEEAESIPTHLSADENAELFTETISSGKITPVSKLLAMNGALAKYAYDENSDMKSNYNEILQAMTDGTVKEKMDSLRSV